MYQHRSIDRLLIAILKTTPRCARKSSFEPTSAKHLETTQELPFKQNCRHQNTTTTVYQMRFRQTKYKLSWSLHALQFTISREVSEISNNLINLTSNHRNYNTKLEVRNNPRREANNRNCQI